MINYIFIIILFKEFNIIVYNDEQYSFKNR